METSFALTGKGYTLVASDTTAARSIVKMKVDEDRIKVLSSHLVMAYSGEPGAFFHPILYHPSNSHIFKATQSTSLSS